MTEHDLKIGSTIAIQKPVFDKLLAALQTQGYETIGPRIRGAVLKYEQVDSLADMPRGYTSQQNGGHYRLQKKEHERVFDITPGADSWKQFLFPARSELFQMVKQNGHWETNYPEPTIPRYAFIGVRGCELAAIAIQDKVFIREDFTDPIYEARRKNLFILAANCLHPGDTCFCASMGTGPEVTEGFDLKLTELDEVFLVEVGSEAGRVVMQDLDREPASSFWFQNAQKAIDEARLSMGRELPDVDAVPELLLSNLEHANWHAVANRCMSCTSCTQVCPTCFCWDVEDTTALDGKTTSRERVWDSCFSLAYSSQAGGNTRPTTHSRYRQWLTHKMGSWQEQFDVLGCVGCGRCITWCPSGIDLTEEIKALREAVSA